MASFMNFTKMQVLWILAPTFKKYFPAEETLTYGMSSVKYVQSKFQAVWPVKSHQMSIKVAQKWFH